MPGKVDDEKRSQGSTRTRTSHEGFGSVGRLWAGKVPSIEHYFELGVACVSGVFSCSGRVGPNYSPKISNSLG